MKLLPAKELTIILLVTLLWIAAVFSIIIKLDDSRKPSGDPAPLQVRYVEEKTEPLPQQEGAVENAPLDVELEKVEEIEEIEEVGPIDAPFEGKTVNDVIGVGGGAGGKFGGRFGGKYRRRAAKAGAVGRPALSHGGTDLVNDGAYDLQFFKTYGVNPFIDTDDDALSTFAVDVDTGAYTICRSFLNDGNLPKPEAVRVEEFVNYFDYGYAPPFSGTFAASILGGPSPFATNRRLLAIGVKGMEIDLPQRKDAVLTFVIDTSGSMKRENRLELVKQALKLLVEQLRPTDEIAIAVYGSHGRKVLGHTPLSEGKAVILDAVERLEPGGSTNAEEGLRIGYGMAAERCKEGCINRVILCSDGVANVGKTGPESILQVIQEQVKKGICLTTVGFGMDNYNDVLMERLGDKGNGHYAYVDDIEEARRVFVEGLTGTLQVIARDAKIQVEFNPKTVRSYRLLGYENRKVADKDFRNEKVDGGEVGAGHSVTALYEIKMWEERDPLAPVGWFRIRYKNPDYTEEVHEHQTVIREDRFAGSLNEAENAFRLAACTATFAEILRGSHWAEGLSMAAVAEEAAALAADLPDDKKIAELKSLTAKAEALIKAREAKRDGVTTQASIVPPGE
jgi:Ca-activated chloride channel family protein